MAHDRPRHALARIKKLASFWPVVGVMGLRQSGKSTLFREQIRHKNYVTFDDDDQRAEAEASSKAYLAKHELPLVIDEVQKVPSVFDAIKSAVDRRRIPGSFLLTGSSAFSAQKETKESLTGRIGVLSLYPFTLAEMHRLELEPQRCRVVHAKKPRIRIEAFSATLSSGGLPVPAFTRDKMMREDYWKNWIATTLGRDLARVYGRGYDTDFAERILHETVKLQARGEWVQVSSFKYDTRKVRKYLSALRDVFVLKMIPCHEQGVGRDVYWLSDPGMLHALSRHESGEEISQALVRLRVFNEIFANCEYAGKSERWTYYKSAKGDPIDLIWGNVPIKIVSSVKQLGWQERALGGAMQTLKSRYGLLVGPTDSIELPKKGGVGLVPWTFWS